MESYRKTENGKLVGLIADEGTCVGFLLAGVGECNNHGQMNFLAVDEDTKDSTIENFFNELCHRHDVGLILIDEEITKKLSQTIKSWLEPFPIILEIPSRSQLFAVKSEGILMQALNNK